MDKEKEIQKMADIAEIYCSNHFDEKICNNEDDCNKCTFYALAEAGYRKADEVRLETAINVLRELRDEFIDMTAYAVGVTVGDVDHTEISVTDVIDIIDEYLKKYGIEMEE